MVRWLVNTILQAIGLLLIAHVLEPNFYIASPWVALLAAVVIRFVFRFIRPILSLITLPLQIITLGLFRLLLNGLLFYFASSLLGPKFFLASFGTAVIASMLYSIYQWFSERLTGDIGLYREDHYY